jgi:uncharacterized membrane protein
MKWIIAVLAVEAIVEILIHSELLDSIRPTRGLLGKLFGCGWCLSVWVAGLAFALVLTHLWFVLVPFAIARAANFTHEIYSRLRG